MDNIEDLRTMCSFIIYPDDPHCRMRTQLFSVLVSTPTTKLFTFFYSPTKHVEKINLRIRKYPIFLLIKPI